MIQIRLFGGFQLSRNGLPPNMKKSRRADSLIAFLAVNLGKQLQREFLVSTLCVDMNKPSDGFRTVLKFARDTLGTRPHSENNECYIQTDKTTILLYPDEHLTVDVALFSTPSPLSPTLTIEELAEKATLYVGPFLQGYETEEYNMDWVLAERARLETRFDQIMQQLVDKLLHVQRWREVPEWAEHWLHHVHLPEAAYAALMMAYARLNDLGKLTETLDRYDRDMSAAELRLSDAILKLHDKLKAELEKGRTIGVDTDAAFAPNRPRELPRQSTTFVGREDHLRTIAESLTDPTCRLLSLIGFGGVGKTRLALQAAHIAAPDFPDGVAYVEMARVKSGEGFFSTLADAVSFSPYGQESLQTQVTHYLREKRLLLILDAFEHVLDPTDSDFDPVTLLEQYLLTPAPGLKIIATSRRLLRAGEGRVLDLDGLDYPDRQRPAAKAPGDYDAVRLFLQIARNRKNDFDVQAALPDVVRICQQVQGMPLAIALAAAQIRYFPCSAIADELTRNLDVLATDDTLVEPRQRTVRAAFDYAWEQLSPTEQAVFRNLAVFPGNFNLDAARRVTGAALGVLRSLVDWSLLQLDGTRYQLHDLLRQFGNEKLSDVSELDAYQRFVQFYLELAQTKQKDYPALEPEWGNLLTGMRFAHERQQWQIVINYAQTLSEPWFTRGRFTEMRVGMKWGCEASQAQTDYQSQAFFDIQLGRACVEQGDYSEASRLFSESATLSEKLGNDLGLATARFARARVALELSMYEDALQDTLVSRQIYERIDDQMGIAASYYEEARILYVYRNFDQAEILVRKAIEIQNNFINKRPLAWTLRLFALVLSAKALHEEAIRQADIALALTESIQDQYQYAIALYDMTQVYRKANRLDSAEKSGLTSLEILLTMGDRKTQAHLYLQLSYIREYYKDLNLAEQYAQRGLDLYQSLNDRWGVVQSLDQLGDIAQATSNIELAKNFWKDTLTLAQSLNHPSSDLVQLKLEKLGG
jgi:predicted ATPase/DNA-binding SARP family transcriptional activator